MKQLLILTVTILAFTFTSCNQKHCWNCTVTYKNSAQFPDLNGDPGTGVKILKVCDKTKKEIQQYETDNSITDATNTMSVEYDCPRDYYK